MIPNFKTYLIESVWGDLRKKSLGQEIREEDNIDDLDREGFYEYLNDLYISRNPNRNIIQGAIEDWPITMPFVSHNKMYNLEIQYMPNNRDVDYVSVPDACIMWYDGLEDMFDVDGNPDDETKIRLLPKDGKPVTNSFAIVVIDWLLEHSDDPDQNLFDKRTDESVWGDIRKKSLGQEVRVENDIDLMSIDDFMEYLKNRYKCNIPRKRYKVENWFLGGEDKLMQVDIPIEDISEPGIKMTYCLRLTYDYGKKECIDIGSSYQTFFEEYPEFKKYVSDNYQLIKKSKDDFRIGSDNLIVSKPGKELKFHDYVKLIDKALSCVKKPYLKMVMNESVWGDIRKKSMGQEERIEDSFENMNIVDFYEYIREHYNFKILGFNNLEIRSDDIVLSLPLFDYKNRSIQHITFHVEKRIKKIIIHVSFREQDGGLFAKLKYRYKVLGDPRVDPVRYFIKPKDPEKKITNRFMLEVFDFIVDNMSPSNKILIEKK